VAIDDHEHAILLCVRFSWSFLGRVSDILLIALEYLIDRETTVKHFTVR